MNMDIQDMEDFRWEFPWQLAVGTFLGVAIFFFVILPWWAGR